MSNRTLADLLDELSQAAESAATAYEHGSLGEAKERDKYVRALKVDILAMFTEALAAHPAPEPERDLPQSLMGIDPNYTPTPTGREPRGCPTPGACSCPPTPETTP